MKSVFPKALLVLSLLILPASIGSIPTSTAASPQLSDISASAGLYWNERTWSASAVDYNNDGYQDIWVGFHQRVDSKLMRNNKDGTFTHVAPEFTKRVNSQGGILDRHDCAWADVDGNTLQDAYCSGGRNMSNYVKTANKDNELWLQLTPGEFTDVGTEWGVGDECGRGRHLAFLDLNNDGFQDLFLGNEKPRSVSADPCDNPANGLTNEESKVFLNQAGNGLRYAPAYDVSQSSAGVGCALALDWNKDGLMDLLACNYRTSKPQLYRNTGSGFVEYTGFSLTAITDAQWADINTDGLKDLVMSDRVGFLYRLGTPTGIGPVVRLPHTNTVTGHFGWGVAVGDINGNGTIDIYGQIHNTNLTSNPDDAVFMSGGGSTPTFTKLVPPSATGNGDSVTALQMNPTANVTFFVQNGREANNGPTQLIRHQN